MNNKRPLAKVFLVIIVALVATVLSRQVGSQQDVVNYLQERFQQQNIPVSEIIILNPDPLQIEITVQSLSDGEVGTPEDSMNVLMVSREVKLANKNGYHIAALVTNLINKSGVSLYQDSGPLNDEIISSVETFDLSKPVLSDEVTKDLVAKRLNLYGLSLTSIDVNTFDGIQTVTLKLSTESEGEASRSLSSFIPYLQVVFPDVNAQGAQIGLCKVELRGKDDELLFNYTLDIQTRESSWWQAEGFVTDW